MKHNRDHLTIIKKNCVGLTSCAIFSILICTQKMLWTFTLISSTFYFYILNIIYLQLIKKYFCNLIYYCMNVICIYSFKGQFKCFRARHDFFLYCCQLLLITSSILFNSLGVRFYNQDWCWFTNLPSTKYEEVLQNFSYFYSK